MERVNSINIIKISKSLLVPPLGLIISGIFQYFFGTRIRQNFSKITKNSLHVSVGLIEVEFNESSCVKAGYSQIAIEIDRPSLVSKTEKVQ